MNSALTYPVYLYVPPVFFLLSLSFEHTVAIRLVSFFLFLLIFIREGFGKKISRPYCIEVLCLWLLLALFSLFTAVDLQYSLNEIKTEIIYGFLCFFAFYFFTKNIYPLKIFIYTISIAVICASFWAIFSFHTYGYWIKDAIFGGVGGLSTIIITTFPIILYTVFTAIKKSPKRKYKFILIVFNLMLISGIIYAAYLTKNIMFWLALAAQMVAFLIFFRLPRKKIFLAVLTPILVIFLFYAMYSVSSQKGRMDDFSIASTTKMLNKDSRVSVWHNIIEKIAESPLQGKGFGRETLGKAYPDISDNPVFWHSHNIFLDAGIQMGIPGMIALVAIFGCIGWFFYRLRQIGDTELLIISAVGIAIIVGVITKNISDSFFNRHWALLFWAQMGILMGYASVKLRAYEASEKFGG